MRFKKFNLTSECRVACEIAERGGRKVAKILHYS